MHDTVMMIDAITTPDLLLCSPDAAWISLFWSGWSLARLQLREKGGSGPESSFFLPTAAGPCGAGYKHTVHSASAAPTWRTAPGPWGPYGRRPHMQAAPGRAESPETASERPVYRVECPQLRLCRIAQMSESPYVRIAQHVRNCPHLHPVESLLAPPRSACIHSWGGDGGRRRAGLFWRVLASTTTSIIFFTFTTDLTLVSCGRSKCLSSRSEAGCWGVSLATPYWQRINWSR